MLRLATLHVDNLHQYADKTHRMFEIRKSAATIENRRHLGVTDKGGKYFRGELERGVLQETGVMKARPQFHFRALR